MYEILEQVQDDGYCDAGGLPEFWLLPNWNGMGGGTGGGAVGSLTCGDDEDISVKGAG